MNYAALFSGGKDSALALWKAQLNELNVEYIMTVHPERDDSYMFHKPNLEFVRELADSLGIDLVEVRTEGEKEKELSDLSGALDELDIDGLVTGAVASNYQMDRIERIASEKGLEVFAPLWYMDQGELMHELLNDDFEVIIVSVAAMGFDDSWLGRKVDESCINDLMELNKKYEVNIAGEGGEYESFVLDAPNFKWGFKVVEAVKEWDGHRGTYDIIELEKNEK